MRRVYWDTMIFVYLLEAHPKFGPRVRTIQQTMAARGDILCSSSFVYGELLVGPLQTGDTAGADLIDELFRSELILTLPYPLQAAKTYAHLRAKEKIKPLDALHLSIAATAGVDLFLTNDRRLHHLNVTGIRFIATLETDLF